MKYTFAIACLLAFASFDQVSAVRISAEPVVKKEEPKKDEAALKAKLDARAEEKKKLDEKAKEAETKKMNESEAEADRKSKEYQSAYDKNMADQKAETKRIEELRARPAGAKDPMESHDKVADSASEHWTFNMPDHILKNDVGPTAAWDSPAPPKKEVSDKPAGDAKK